MRIERRGQALGHCRIHVLIEDLDGLRCRYEGLGELEEKEHK